MGGESGEDSLHLHDVSNDLVPSLVDDGLVGVPDESSHLNDGVQALLWVEAQLSFSLSGLSGNGNSEGSQEEGQDEDGGGFHIYL